MTRRRVGRGAAPFDAGKFPLPWLTWWMYSAPAVEPVLNPDEVVHQRRYGVLPLNYGAKCQFAPVGLEPTISGLWGMYSETAVRISSNSNFTLLQSRVRGSHPALQAHEARMSSGPPASCRSRYRTGRTGHMKASWVPAHLQCLGDEDESRTRMPQGHAVLNVECLPTDTSECPAGIAAPRRRPTCGRCPQLRYRAQVRKNPVPFATPGQK